jgi:hypothetical protein
MKFWPARLAALVWLAWLVLLGLMAGMLWLDVWHPPFLLIPAVLAVMLAACVALILAAAWRLARGPRRAVALACLLLGLAPAAFLAGHLMYGFGTAYGRQLELNLPLKLLVPFGESILDVVACHPYPQRTWGQRVVMISQPMPEDVARRQVAAMERHVRALEQRLSRTSRRRIYWVRGPILGIQGKAIHSMCLGSFAADSPAIPDELNPLDRHEVAHVVMCQFAPLDAEPPALLVEGWAEANSGMEPRSLVFRASLDRDAGEGHSVAELLAPSWYSRHEGPVYLLGAVVANRLLSDFGPERFVELYATCRRKTFDADCRRVLGLSVDELDAACRDELDGGKAPGGYRRQWLAALELGPGIDRSAWDRFVSDYLAAADRLQAPYEHVRMKAQIVHSTPYRDPKAPPATWRYEMRANGSLRALRWSTPQREEVLLAHPERSLRAELEVQGGAWTIRDRPGIPPAESYRRIRHEIDSTGPVGEVMLPLLGLADMATGLVDPLCLKVTKLERCEEDRQPFIRLELEATSRGHPLFQKIRYRFAAGDHRLVHREMWNRSGHHWTEDLEYEFRDGVPLLRASTSEGRWEDDGTPARSVLTVTDRRFETVPDAEFTAEHLLQGAPVRHVSEDPAALETSRLLVWSRLPVLAGLVFLVAGAGLAVAMRVREPLAGASCCPQTASGPGSPS